MKHESPLTGRMFMCLGIDEHDEDFIIESFQTCLSYSEVKYDIDGINLCEDDELLLLGESGLAVYVRREDFALMLDASTELVGAINRMTNEAFE